MARPRGLYAVGVTATTHDNKITHYESKCNAYSERAEILEVGLSNYSLIFFNKYLNYY